MKIKNLFLGVITLTMILSSCSISAKNCDTKLSDCVTSSSGNLEGVKEAVAEGANVNKTVWSDNTRFGYKDNDPATLALCISNNYDITKYLIEHGSNPNYTGDLGISFLMDAARSCDIDFCNYLISHGAKINQEGKSE